MGRVVLVALCMVVAVCGERLNPSDGNTWDDFGGVVPATVSPRPVPQTP